MQLNKLERNVVQAHPTLLAHTQHCGLDLRKNKLAARGLNIAGIGLLFVYGWLLLHMLPLHAPMPKYCNSKSEEVLSLAIGLGLCSSCCMA